MLKSVIPFDKVSQLAKTDVAYATGDPNLAPFYKYDLQNETFQRIIADKGKADIPRDLLVRVLKEQYEKLPANPLVSANIEALASEMTFTVTTAHQPCLFLGPVYFNYKALTTINLAEAASGLVSGLYKIVPVFVLGSEDHDLAELNHATLYSKKIEWNPTETGPVGSISLAEMGPALAQLQGILGDSDVGRNLFARVKRAYSNGRNFAEATQALLHEFFGRFGLVVLNMNHPDLKRQFLPILRDELTAQTASRLVSETIEKLNAAGFRTQAAPREINLFYMLPGLRERIVLEDGIFKVLNTEHRFSPAEMLAEAEAHPERFSPNVVLRPLFQEMILPNLAYVGGGGELAYWLERKSLFEHFGINFPLLVRRNSVVWLDREMMRRLQRFGFSSTRMFEDSDSLVRFYIENVAQAEIGLGAEMADLKKIFVRVEQKAVAVDPSLEKAVRADALKFVEGLEQWQSRLLRAEKAKHEVTLGQIRTFKEKVFPGGGLQERVDNFMQFYLKYGEHYLVELKEKLLPLERGFLILEDKS